MLDTAEGPEGTVAATAEVMLVPTTGDIMAAATTAVTAKGRTHRSLLTAAVAARGALAWPFARCRN
ncbi:hypothetical protein [Streptomyces sp. NPDC007905]|uniref:hypothetical protein n=1 Tax=Streptomyces sp. NPDC007905 TaxID=3364788 RepID=UPI0036EAB9DC